eukprot:6207985-Pleurochrysis_carterae.AAC.5
MAQLISDDDVTFGGIVWCGVHEADVSASTRSQNNLWCIPFNSESFNDDAPAVLIATGTSLLRFRPDMSAVSKLLSVPLY